jgi:Flp pilus assembly protein TadG
MIRNRNPRQTRAGRHGKTLVMFGLLLPILLGAVGLAIDTGLMLATYRQTQNAADAAALAAAVDVLHGAATSAAEGTGKTYVQTYNNMPTATVTINIPPATGPHAGSAHYVEAIVSHPYKTSFVQMLGLNKNQTVGARSVAGWEFVSVSAAVMTVQPNPPGNKGIQASGGTTLSVNGTIIDDATDGTHALDVSGGGNIFASQVIVSGGASGASKVESYPSGGGPSPLIDNTGINVPDPFASLPAPYTGSPGIYKVINSPDPPGNKPPTPSGVISVSNGQTQVIYPGVYSSIKITGGTVTFNPGIYVVTGGKTNAIDITGGTVTGTSVFFYDTASNYDPTTGNDSGSGKSSFGGINISGSGVNLSGLVDPSSPYNGMVFFMDRANTGSGGSNTISIQGGSSGATIVGTTYAPNTNVQVSGQGTWNAQFIVGLMSVTGGGNVTINYSGQNQAQAPQVFLVE